MTISNVQQTGISGHVIPNKKLAYWESIIEEWTMIKTITNGYKGEMIFWHFPSASRRLIGGSGKNYWPGVIVIARQI